MPIKVPCQRPPSRKGLSVLDLQHLADMLALPRIANESKRTLCERVNAMHNEADDQLIADFLRERALDVEYVVDKILYDEQRQIKGKTHVKVYWAGYDEPTWEPLADLPAPDDLSKKTLFGEQEAAAVLASLKKSK